MSAGDRADGAGAGDDSDRYCAQLVREHARERFLAALFAPADRRAHLYALYAFDAEIARVGGSVSEPMPGEIRLQWWHDSVESLFAGGAVDHPVARALARAVAAGPLPKQPFLDLIAARRFDLYEDPMPTVNDLEGYAGETASVVIQMACVLLAGADAARCSEAAGHAGVAQTVVRVLASIPQQRARGQMYVPEELLAACELKPAHFLSGRWGEAMATAFAQLRRVADDHLREARALDGQVPAQALPAFLPVSVLDLYLARMSRRGFNPFTDSVEISRLRRQWRLWRASLAGRF